MSRLDNSGFTKYRFCPLAYKERYIEVHPDALPVRIMPEGSIQQAGGDIPLAEDTPHDAGRVPVGLVSVAPAPARDFGTRFHQLVAGHRRGLAGIQRNGPAEPEWPDEDIELECRAVFAQYLAAYPTEPYEFLSVERTEHVPIPRAIYQPGGEGSEHECTVRIDAVVRFPDGTIGPLDTKTERHGSRSNTREAWVGRTQAGLYLWACAQLYPQETVSRMVVDVVTRGSAKFPPSFRRMDDISQPLSMQEDAVRNVVQVAQEVQRCKDSGWWPSNKNSCVDWFGKPCEYFPLHILGRTDANLRLYKPAVDYLAEAE